VARPGRKFQERSDTGKLAYAGAVIRAAVPADVTVTAAALGGVPVATGQAIGMNGGPGN
jgi:hypothetical protein